MFSITWLALEVRGQSIFNSSNIFIEENAEIHTEGSVENHGFIENNGAIYFSAEWHNANLYQGSGTVIANGALQKFANNGQPLYNLIVSNAGLVISDSVTISGELALSSGIIRFEERGSLTIEESAKIEGGSGTSFIERKVYVEGTGFHSLPLGNDGLFLPLILNDVKGIDPVIAISAMKNISDSPIEGFQEMSGFYWQRTMVSGTFDRSTISLPLVGVEQEEQLAMFTSTDGETYQALGVVPTTSHYGVSFVRSEQEIEGAFFGLGVANLPEEDLFYLSTTLSPGALASENKYVKVFGETLEENQFRFSVFDRWGKEVYTTTSLSLMQETGWDGRTSRNEVLPSGTYPYVLNARGKNGKLLTMKGMLTIVN